MVAKELLAAGRLSETLELLNREVRTAPADLRKRTLLFEALCFIGDYERAGRQLDVIAQLDERSVAGAHLYLNVLAAERSRQRLLSDGLAPHFLLEPPPFAHLHLEAFNRLREGRAAAARALLEQAAEIQGEVAGNLGDRSFADISDADALLGPFLEVIVQDRYVWLPFAQIKRLAVAAPDKLRDLLWIPANLELKDGSLSDAFIPVLYAGSGSHPDDQIKLGRATNWENTGGVTRGVGQRILFIDDSERPVLQLGEIVFASE